MSGNAGVLSKKAIPCKVLVKIEETRQQLLEQHLSTNGVILKDIRRIRPLPEPITPRRRDSNSSPILEHLDEDEEILDDELEHCTEEGVEQLNEEEDEFDLPEPTSFLIDEEV